MARVWSTQKKAARDRKSCSVRDPCAAAVTALKFLCTEPSPLLCSVPHLFSGSTELPCISHITSPGSMVTIHQEVTSRLPTDGLIQCSTCSYAGELLSLTQILGSFCSVWQSAWEGKTQDTRSLDTAGHHSHVTSTLKASHHCGHAETPKSPQAATPGQANLQNSCSSGVNVEKHRCFVVVEEHKSLAVIFSKYFPPF